MTAQNTATMTEASSVTGRLMTPAVVMATALVAVLCWLAVCGPAMAAGAPRARAQRLVLAPRGGQLVGSDLVRIAVRSGDESGALSVRLNGVQIGDDFTVGRREVRTLVASVSHGLRRGRNLLRVRVRRLGLPARTATVRFVVRSTGPLVGAGRDRRVVVGDVTVLDGRDLGGKARGRDALVHWRAVSAPRRYAARRATSAATVLSHPDEVAAGFRADAPGRYTLRLTAGSGSTARSDSVTLSVVPPTPLVSIDTMVRSAYDVPGIRVGATTYSTPGIFGFPNAVVEILVLDRQTLGFVSNTTYDDTNAVEAALRKLDASKLVIAVLQRPGGRGINPLRGESLAQALAPIGFPKLTTVPRSGGSVSAIGVPGTNPGDANVNVHLDVNVDNKPGKYGGEMQGYLTPDQHLEYGFVSSKRISVAYPKLPAGCPPDTSGCDNVGFLVDDIDPRTYELLAQRFFYTNSRSLSIDQHGAQAQDMATFLNRIPAGDLVRIETKSNRGSPVAARYRPPVGLVDRAAMVRLAAAVAGVGGTRNAFNHEALSFGPADGAPVYSLIGWAGAGEGNGGEAALGIDSTGETPDLSTVLRRDREYVLRPVQTSTFGPVPDTLENLILQPPTDTWPDSGPALNYVGEIDKRLGCDPRSAYWTGSLTEPDLNAIAENIREAVYPGTGAPDPCTNGSVQFTDAQFRAARTELLEELGWVGNVRSYLAKLASPFADGALQSWTQAQTIADQIYREAKKPDDKTSLRWIQFTSNMIKLVGAASFNPISGGVAGIMGNLLDFGVWVAGASKDGTPGGDEVRFKADELGAQLVDQAQQAQATYARIGDIIVGDYAKLRVVGANGGCNPNSPGCPKEFAYTERDKVAFSAAFYRGIQRIAYEKLLPLGYRVYQLKNPQRLSRSDRGRPPNVPEWYHCGRTHPFYAFPPLAYTSLLQELEPLGHINLYDVFALSLPRGQFEVHGTPPPDGLLKRMFDPVSKSNDPNVGGLGISPAELMRTAKHYAWSVNDPNGQDCYFG